jgi:hypothetical protein
MSESDSSMSITFTSTEIAGEGGICMTPHRTSAEA